MYSMTRYVFMAMYGYFNHILEPYTFSRSIDEGNEFIGANPSKSQPRNSRPNAESSFLLFYS